MVRSRGPRPRHAGRTRLRTSTSRCHQTNAAWPSRWEPGVRKTVDIWIIDIARNVRSRLTVDPGTRCGRRCGRRTARASHSKAARSGKVSLRQKLINGTAADESLLEGLGQSYHGARAAGPRMDVSSRIRRRSVPRHPMSGSFRCSAIANRFRWHKPRSSKTRRCVLSGWTMDRVHEQRRRPAQRLCSTVSRGRREISGIEGRREPSCLASGWQGVVLPRSGRDPDGGADRRDRSIRGRSAAGPLPDRRARDLQPPARCTP